MKRRNAFLTFLAFRRRSFLLCTFPCFLFSLAALMAAPDVEVRFLRGLVDRNLFESAEYFCNDEFRKESLAVETKYLMAAELVRSRTRQAILAEPSQRGPIRHKLEQIETEFLGSPDAMTDVEVSSARIEFRFQLAISDYSLGDWLRLEADVVPEADREERIKEARRTLYNSLERFKQCFEEIDALRRKAVSGNDPGFERRSLALLWSIRSQWSLAQVSLALSFPPAEDRKFSLDRAVEMLSELASLGIADPVVFRSRIELARCYRLLGETERSKEQLVILDNVKLTGELLFQAKAELIRYYLAVGAVDEAIRLFDVPEPEQTVYPDYDIARLELLLADSHRIKQASVAVRTDIAQPEIEAVLRRILDAVRLIQQQSGPYWGRRARMVLSSSHLAVSQTADAALIKMLADDQFQEGRYTEAVRLYEQASRAAKNAGDEMAAFRYAASSIGVLNEVMERLTTAVSTATNTDGTVSGEDVIVARQRLIDSIRQLSKSFSEMSDAPEYHLKAVDLTAEAVRKKQGDLSDYIAILKEHAEFWPDSPKVPPSLLRAALLVEQQGNMTEALAILEKIPNHSNVGLDAVRAARRCFETLSGTLAESQSDRRDEIDLKEAEWFRRRLPENNNSWSEADAFSALRAAECRLGLFARAVDKTKALEHPKVAEELLRATERCPELTPTLKAQTQAMLVRTLTDLGRKDEGAEILNRLDTDRIETLSGEEKIAFQRVRAQLLAETGKTQEAVNLLAELLNQHPEDFSIWEVSAEILTKQESPKTLARAQQHWTWIAEGTDPKSDLWWTARERIIEIHLRLGQEEEAKKQFELLRILHPELGGTARRARLEKHFSDK